MQLGYMYIDTTSHLLQYFTSEYKFMIIYQIIYILLFSRWRFIVHGCIDGYSRKIMYLSCQTDNCASTVHALFVDRVDKYWIHQRVRSDHGTENVDVARHMLCHPDRGPGSFITGRSVHNQRKNVERCFCWLYIHLLLTVPVSRG